MFPLTNKEPYIMATGERTTLGDMLTKNDADINQLKEDLIDEAETRAALGAHNLMKYPFVDTSKTVNGVVFTDNGDGTITITTNGSPSTGQAIFSLWEPASVPRGYLSGCPTGGSDSKYFMQLISSSQSLNIKDYGTAKEIPATTANDIWFRIVVPSGSTISTPITFKPMFRIFTDADTTYQPYAMTNQELTDAVEIEPITLTGYSDTTVYGGGYRMGNICIISGTWINATGLAANAAIFHASVPAAAATTQGGILVKGSNDAGAGISTYAIDTAGDVRQGITSQNIFAGSFFLVYKC